MQHAVRAQFGASMGTLLRPIDRIRATRHAVDYLDEETWLDADADAVQADLPKAQKIVDAAETAIGHLTVLGALSARAGPDSQDTRVRRWAPADTAVVSKALELAPRRIRVNAIAPG